MIELQLKLSSSWTNRSFKTIIENKSFSGEKTLQHEMRLMEEKILVPLEEKTIWKIILRHSDDWASGYTLHRYKINVICMHLLMLNNEFQLI